MSARASRGISALTSLNRDARFVGGDALRFGRANRRRHGGGHGRGHGAWRRHAQQFTGDDRAGAEHQGRQCRNQHDRQFLRIGRGIGNGGAGNDPPVSRCRVDILPVSFQAIFRQIGPRRSRCAWLPAPAPELDVVAVGRGRLLLQLLEARTEAFNLPLAMRASLSSEREILSPLPAAGGRDRQAAPSVP